MNSYNLLFGATNNVDQLLNKSDVTLKDLLEEEGIIQEFRCQNQKLMTFMNHQKFEELIKYIIVLPMESDTEKRQYRFPFISCELLCCDILEVYDAFFNYVKPAEEQDDSDDSDELQEEDNENQEENNQKSQRNKQEEEEENEEETIVDVADENEDDDYRRKPNAKQRVPYSSASDENNNERGERITKNITGINIKHKGEQSSDFKEKAQSHIRYLSSANQSSSRNRNEQQDADQRDHERQVQLHQKKQIAEEQKASPGSNEKKQIQQKKEKREPAIPEPPRPPTYLLSTLFNFVKELTPVNITSAGYFAKVAHHLYTKRQPQLVDFIYTQDDTLMKDMTNHFHSQSIAELFGKMLFFETQNVDENAFLETRKILVNDLVVFLGNDSYEPQVYSNIQGILGEFSVKYGLVNKGKDLFLQLINEENFKSLCQNVQSSTRAISTTSVHVLTNLFNQFLTIKSNQEKESAGDGDGDLDGYVDYSHSLQILKNYIPDYLELLGEGSGSPIRSTNQNTLNPPLGTQRLKIAELLLMALKMNEDQLNFEILVSNNFLQVLMDLFLKYQWNNLLHNIFEKVTTVVLDSQNQNLIKSVFYEQNNILDFFDEAVFDNQYLKKNDFTGRQIPMELGYLGHINKLASQILLLSKRYPFLKSLVETQKWEQFYTKYLKIAIEREQKNLGGHQTKRGSVEEDYGENISFTQQELANKYQGFLTGNKNQKEDDDEVEIEEEIEPINKDGDDNEEELIETGENVKEINESSQDKQKQASEEQKEDPFAQFIQPVIDIQNFENIEESKNVNFNWDQWNATTNQSESGNTEEKEKENNQFIYHTAETGSSQVQEPANIVTPPAPTDATENKESEG